MCCLRVIIIIFWISTLVNSGGFSSIDWSIRLHHHHVSVSAADSSSAGSITTTTNTTAAPVAIPTAVTTTIPTATTTTTTTTGGGGGVARSGSQNKVMNNRDLCRIICIYLPERTGRLL